MVLICISLMLSDDEHLYTAERKKELLPFATAWMESIMLSEISQAVKDKYHIILPTGGT